MGVELQNKKAVLRFAGERGQVFDAVIGADGIRSAVRESLGWQGESKTTGETYLRRVADTCTGESAAREIWGIDG